MFKEKIGKVVNSRSEKGKNLRIVRRDLEVLRFILEQGQLSIDMIFERFYRYGEEERRLKYLQNRISRLKNSGYIRTHWTHDGPKKWITATKKAKDIVEGEYPENKCALKVYEQIRLNQFNHDKYASQLRIMLELENSNLDWREEEIDVKVIPDGSFTLDGDNYRLEFENVRKSLKFIENKVHKYFVAAKHRGHRDEKVGAVLLVCMDLKTLNNYKREYRKKTKKEAEYFLKLMDNEINFSGMSIDDLGSFKSKLKNNLDELGKIIFKFLLFKDLVDLYEEKGRSSEQYLCELIKNTDMAEYIAYEDFYNKTSLDIENQVGKINGHEFISYIKDNFKEKISIEELDDEAASRREEVRLRRVESSKKSSFMDIFK